MCPSCILAIPKRYNPFEAYDETQRDPESDSDHFYNQDFQEEISYINQAGTILKNCINYLARSLASLSNEVDNDFSTIYIL